jgi:NAD(P)H-flavin reductase
MHVDTSDISSSHEIIVTEDVRRYILDRKCDFRVCTSCGGPILLQATVKPPKSTDLEIYVGDHTIYISMYQARYLDRIDMSMVPRFCDYF